MKLTGFNGSIKKLIVHKADRTETFEFKKKTHCTIFTANLPWELIVCADGITDTKVQSFKCPEHGTLEVEEYK